MVLKQVQRKVIKPEIKGSVMYYINIPKILHEKYKDVKRAHLLLDTETGLMIVSPDERILEKLMKIAAQTK